MSGQPKIEEQQIRDWVGQQSFQRGAEYFQDGAISQTRRQGSILQGQCAGSRSSDYRLWVNLAETGIHSADCSCPVGGGGQCKHVAALLLTWRAHPEQFETATKPEASLERYSKPDLIALLKQMIKLRPEFQELLAAMPPSGGPMVPVDPELYRKKAAAIFSQAYRRGVDIDSIPKLQIIKAAADGFARQQNYASAVAIYAVLIEEVLDKYEFFGDERERPQIIIDGCIEGLQHCLDGEPGAGYRQDALKALFNIYRFDQESGGIEISWPAPDLLVERTTPEERRIVAGWVRSALETTSGEGSDYFRECLGGFLLDLEADEMDDEAYLKVCRDTGRLSDLVDRLLSLDRLEEAVSITYDASDYEMIQLAGCFENHNFGVVAERLMAQRLAKTRDTRVHEWLKKRYIAKGDAKAVLEISGQIFQLVPTLKRYLEIRELACGLGVWGDIQPSLMDQLGNGENSSLLIEVHLAEDDLDLALNALEALPRMFYRDEIAMKVALAAETSKPLEAIGIYKRQVETLIADKQRNSYRAACTLLARIRDICQEIGEQDEWLSYISEIRWRYHKFRALIQETVAAGL
jgi:hypothetical protein